MFVIGSAGHVDHGKSTLINALTGIDPDRLREEKERGMTIDLGFAWLTLPSGHEVSIVDVPGHERFIKNMLAGIGGIDVALLVIAADEGIMPQTEEHLAILDLLQVSRGVVALTKSDLVDEDWLALVREDIVALLSTTTLAGAPIIPCSAVTGQGLADLLAALDRAIATAVPRPDIGKPRLPIDRVFTISGFGTVVTGTLSDGRLVVNQEVEIIPVGSDRRTLRSRIRGLQTHKRKEEMALPGTRVAVNLANVAVEELRRGDVVSVPGWLVPTSALDVRLRAVRTISTSIKHNTTVTVHTGAAEVEGRVILLDQDELAPGSSGWAQLRLAAPLAARRGDFFIIRSPNTTLGGGQVIDAHPPRHRRFQPSVVATMEALARGEPEDLILQTLGAGPPCEIAAIIQRTGLTHEDILRSIEYLGSRGGVLILTPETPLTAKTLVISAAGWDNLAQRAEAILGGYHRQFPLRSGMPQEELKSRLGLSARAFTACLDRWIASKTVILDGTAVRLPAHTVRLSSQQEEQRRTLITALQDRATTPPSLQEVEEAFGSDLVAALIERGEVVRVGESVFLRTTYDAMVQRILGHLEAAGHITVAEVRDMFNTSRKYAIALLEHLDAQRITRRVGDERVLYSAMAEKDP